LFTTINRLGTREQALSFTLHLSEHIRVFIRASSIMAPIWVVYNDKQIRNSRASSLVHVTLIRTHTSVYSSKLDKHSYAFWL